MSEGDGQCESKGLGDCQIEGTNEHVGVVGKVQYPDLQLILNRTDVSHRFLYGESLQTTIKWMAH
jgi:hypothetical protein